MAHGWTLKICAQFRRSEDADAAELMTKNAMISDSAQFGPIFAFWGILCPGSITSEMSIIGTSEASQGARNGGVPRLIRSARFHRGRSRDGVLWPRSTNKWPATLDTLAEAEFLGGPSPKLGIQPFPCRAVPRCPGKSRASRVLIPCVT